jgi:hypothetical protein
MSKPEEDLLDEEEQPFETPTRLNYRESLKHIKVQELARRSDIIITSTMSVSMFPSDNRLIE